MENTEKKRDKANLSHLPTEKPVTHVCNTERGWEVDLQIQLQSIFYYCYRLTSTFNRKYNKNLFGGVPLETLKFKLCLLSAHRSFNFDRLGDCLLCFVIFSCGTEL